MIKIPPEHAFSILETEINDDAYFVDQRRWDSRRRTEGSRCGARRICDGQRRGAQPRTERRGAIAYSAPADYLPQRGGAAVGRRRYAGGRSYCCAATASAPAAPPDYFLD